MEHTHAVVVYATESVASHSGDPNFYLSVKVPTTGLHHGTMEQDLKNPNVHISETFLQMETRPGTSTLGGTPSCGSTRGQTCTATCEDSQRPDDGLVIHVPCYRLD